MRLGKIHNYLQFSWWYFKVTEAETECGCLNRRQLEEDLKRGVNPLGQDSKQCYQISSDMINLLKNGKYKISQIISYDLIFWIDTNSEADTVSCPLGFTQVCNSRLNTLNRTAICPRENEEVWKINLLSVQFKVFQGHWGWDRMQLSAKETGGRGPDKWRQSSGTAQ